MHGNTTSVWPGTSTTAITTALLGHTDGGYKLMEVLWEILQNNRGVTKGDPVYLTLFNIILDAAARATPQEICGP